jgi:hypothetical protein
MNWRTTPWTIGPRQTTANAQHQRDAGAVDVGVEQARAEAELRQRQGEVDGDSALADAALAAAHGDDLLHAREGRLPRRGPVPAT